MLQILIFLGVLIGVLCFGTTIINVTTPASDFYTNAFYGKPPGGIISLTIDPDVLDGTDFVDSDGYIRPGTPFQKDGTLADGAAQPAAYVVPYAVKIAKSNATADLTAATNNSIGVATGGNISKSAVEANIGRVLTADEIANIESTGRFLLV